MAFTFTPSFLQALPSSSRQALTVASKLRSSSKGKSVLRPIHTSFPPSNASEVENRPKTDGYFSAREASKSLPSYRDTNPRGPTHTLHVSSTTNNIILSYTGPTDKTGLIGPVKGVRTITGGSDKDFKKSNRASYEAAHQAAIKMFKAIRERNEKKGYNQDKITVAFKGMFGQGREAVSAALAGPEGVDIQGMVVRVEDRTPIKIGGTRAPKARRL